MNKLIAVHDQGQPASGRVMAKIRYEIFSRGALRDAGDLHEEGRMVTRVHLYPHSGRIFYRKNESGY